MVGGTDEVVKEAASTIKEYRGMLIGIAITAVVLALYWPVANYDFIALDDNLYILENPRVQRGITADNLIWVWTAFDAANWHPLTWLSLMADYELFGLNPGGYHMNSLMIHIVNTLLLFVVLLRMTGECWKSATVSLLFAVHPLNMESVVWIAERKNLLGGFFWLLTLLVYLRYAQRTAWSRYLAVVIVFSLGLMAKPILVTLPVILLLLDYWPLQRFSVPGQARGNAPMTDSHIRRRVILPILVEKIPLLLLSLLSVIITYEAAKAGGAVKSLTLFPFSGRIANAIVSYALYLVKTALPVNLAIFYPYPAIRPAWHVAAALVPVVAVTLFVCVHVIRHRYLTVGWFWYLISLLPVIGLVQVGFQSMANRYAYLPLVGIFILIVWGGSDLVKEEKRRGWLPVAAGLAILILAISTRLQIGYWQNSAMAFERALGVTKNNHIAEIGMGNVWLGRGDLRRARSHYEASLRIKGDYPEAHNNLALTLMQEGRREEAEIHYREALKHNPDDAEVYNNLGVLYALQGKFREAEGCFRRTLHLKPDHRGAGKNLSSLWLDQGKIDQATEGYRATLRLFPGDAEATQNLEKALRIKRSPE